MGNQTRTIAVVLAGAVAKGAFEAGVIRALARAPDLKIARIVAASSGALNGTVLASAVRTGDLVGGGEQLASLWQDHAEWNEVFHLSFRDLLRRDGLSDQERLLGLLSAHIIPSQPDSPHPVNLRLVVAPLGGQTGSIGQRHATTYESVCDFDTADFATRARLDRVFLAAVASSAFPLVFAPVELDGLGPCIDGGSVNNTPLKWALDGELGASIDTVIVVATSAEQRAVPPGELTGVTSLVGHLTDMLIDERLYRDLREADQVNTSLDGLDRLVQTGVLDAAQLRSVKQALGWTRRRHIEIISIRPDSDLRGNAFAAFFDRDLRVEYLAAGSERGLEVLDSLRRTERLAEAATSVRHDDAASVAADPAALPVATDADRAE